MILEHKIVLSALARMLRKNVMRKNLKILFPMTLFLTSMTKVCRFDVVL